MLAGIAEARALASLLAGMPDLKPVASLAGVTAEPAPLAIPTRTGGFGGVTGLADWLGAHAPAVLIDATHPFAARMQRHAVEAAERANTPRLRLLRPPWPPRDGWREVPDLASAAADLPPGARALVTTGSGDIAPFAARPDTTIHLRSIEPVAGLPDHIHPILARPPFTREDETQTLRNLRVTHLVTRDAGGGGTAKLDAAEALRLTTIVVARPPEPPGPIARTPGEAVAWLRQTVAIGA